MILYKIKKKISLQPADGCVGKPDCQQPSYLRCRTSSATVAVHAPKLGSLAEVTPCLPWSKPAALENSALAQTPAI
ncbi:hypothetical protein KL933_001501 [Ogataea haglerorum]|uniref:Uncharacterized protein n=1 Tax=Ogataea haglerorum TaxID=1937702 RepID=A0AAN6D7T5_9ASCO|nr:hypothetical protein KL915_002271 [Ogataea haglerorum]KAG7729275.1 hypothetical protein KL933_001501 [Ogataea haglerorum]